MKTEIPAPSGFKPVEVLLTFESQAELDAFGTLCNHAWIRKALAAIGGEMPDLNVFQAEGAEVVRKIPALSEAIKSSFPTK